MYDEVQGRTGVGVRGQPIIVIPTRTINVFTFIYVFPLVIAGVVVRDLRGQWFPRYRDAVTVLPVGLLLRHVMVQLHTKKSDTALFFSCQQSNKYPYQMYYL